MTTTQTRPARTTLNSGIGRFLIFLYGLFTLSAGARASVQIATRFGQAPLAYVLSAIAAVIYLIATICLARSTPRSRRIGIVCCTVELVGVIVVGTASLFWRSAFPATAWSEDATVWSFYGLGYALVPFLLPIAGLWWLRRGSLQAIPHGEAPAHDAPSANA